MHERFRNVVEVLHPLLEQLTSMNPVRYEALPREIPKQGVYLFSEQADHLYIGRSNNIRRRLGNHCRPSSQHNQAVFAFKLARNSTGQMIPAYRPGVGSRVYLAADQEFGAEFLSAKKRVRSMDIRYVEVKDQQSQAVFELYAAISLGCPFNDFSTH